MQVALGARYIEQARVVHLGSRPQPVRAQNPVAVQHEKSTRALNGAEFELKYRFEPGEEILSKVIHLVTIDTKIEGTAETVETRSVSLRRWKITDVDKRGNITFLHYVDKAKMWQKVTGRPEIRFDSESEEEPPETSDEDDDGEKKDLEVAAGMLEELEQELEH